MTKDENWYILDRELPLRQQLLFCSSVLCTILHCSDAPDFMLEKNNAAVAVRQKMQDIRKTIKVKQPALSLFPIKMIAKQKGH